MICNECKTDNPDNNKYCGSCGKTLAAPPDPIAVPGAPGAFYCQKHPRVSTRIRCGRCDAPVCPKCSVVGAAGIRCKTCAKQRIKVRPIGVIHEAGRVVSNNAPSLGNTVWWLYILRLIASIFRGFR